VNGNNKDTLNGSGSSSSNNIKINATGWMMIICHFFSIIMNALCHTLGNGCVIAAIAISPRQQIEIGICAIDLQTMECSLVQVRMKISEMNSI
jgi:hypothetical protein